MSRFNKFFHYFPQNRNTFFKYSGLSLIVGVLELFGVALTYPFIIKLLDNNEHHGFFDSPIVIGLIIIILFLIKNIFMIFYTYSQSKFVKALEADLNLSFMRYFLLSDYPESSKISVSEKQNILGFLIPHTINNYIMRLLNLNVNLFIFTLISLFLLIKYPLATIITIVFAIVLTTSQNYIFKPKLAKIGDMFNTTSKNFNQRSNESILNIKSVKISNNEEFFYNNYLNAITDFFKVGQKSLFFNSIPPYITEPFIIIMLFIMLLIISVENFSAPQKLVASFAVIISAVFRMAPTISRIQVNLNGINSAKPIIDKFLSTCELYKINSLPPFRSKEYHKLNDSIELKDVDFSYNCNKKALKNINLRIEKGDFIGIAGMSGAGKTTLIDIIAGLYKPDSGEILIDGEKHNDKNLKIGYIPQEFTVINGSIKENVIFGSAINTKTSLDDEVTAALKQAQLYDFVKENFVDGINANPFVDSTGFSHGQKQRLAIARALFTNPDILILDEATSSLDLKTEDEICNVLKSLKGEKTIIAIAHRLSTIKSADKIVFIKNGEISAVAPFETLANQNDDFKELVKLSFLNNN